MKPVCVILKQIIDLEITSWFTRSFEIVHVVSNSRHYIDLSVIMRLLTLDFVSMSLKLYQNARCRVSSDPA